MTELEKVQWARICLDKLANGIDPISGTELPGDSTLNDVRLSRCFFYVSDILRQVAENGGHVNAAVRPRRSAFLIPPALSERFAFSVKPIRISELVDRINALAETDSRKQLSTTVITNWLLDKGFLMLQESPDGKKSRQPTPQGVSIGLSTQTRTGQYGVYNTVYYNEAAQHFVLDNLEAMVSGVVKLSSTRTQAAI